MKRLFLLVAAALLLVSCGLSEAAEDTTASLGTGNEKGGGDNTNIVADDVVVNVDSVKCDVHPWMNSNTAQVTCQLDIMKDALKLGSDGPIKLYLGGMLKVSDSKFIFETDKPFSASGTGNFRACQLGKNWEQGLFYPCGLPFLELTAQIDGWMPWEIVGVASTEGGKGLNILTNNENIVGDLVDFQCEGQMIPNSSLANIIMIGELKDGREVMGGGILDISMATTVSNASDGLRCDVDVSAQGVVFQVETTLITWGGDVATAKITDSETGRPIIFGVVINHEEQYGFSK